MHPRWIPQPSSETIRKSAKLPDFTCKSSFRMKCRLMDVMRIKKHEAVEEQDISGKLNISEIWFRWSFINIAISNRSSQNLVNYSVWEREREWCLQTFRLQGCKLVRFLPARPANLVPDGGWGWPPFEGTMYVCHDILEVGMLVRVKMMRMLTLSICGAIRRSQGRWPDRMNWISTY